MPALLTLTANDLLNRVAVEVGLDQVSDPVASTEKEFIKLAAMLNIAGEELSQNYPWEFLVKEHSITTVAADQEYDLPSDFLYMVNQTGWERTQSNPLSGPLSPQDWQYLAGRDLVSSSIYTSFRINEGVFKVYPDPIPADLEITFEYVSRNWVLDGDTGNTYKDSVTQGSDTPQFDRVLLTRFLKVKWLESTGFDSTKAQSDLNQSFSLLLSREKGAPILNAGGGYRGFPYLSGNSVSDTGYGV